MRRGVGKTPVGTHLLLSGEGGERETTQRASRQPKSGRQTKHAKRCECYELKIDYVAMDQVCTWSHY